MNIFGWLRSRRGRALTAPAEEECRTTKPGCWHRGSMGVMSADGRRGLELRLLGVALGVGSFAMVAATWQWVVYDFDVRGRVGFHCVAVVGGVRCGRRCDYEPSSPRSNTYDVRADGHSGRCACRSRVVSGVDVPRSRRLGRHGDWVADRFAVSGVGPGAARSEAEGCGHSRLCGWGRAVCDVVRALSRRDCHRSTVVQVGDCHSCRCLVIIRRRRVGTVEKGAAA